MTARLVIAGSSGLTPTVTVALSVLLAGSVSAGPPASGATVAPFVRAPQFRNVEETRAVTVMGAAVAAEGRPPRATHDHELAGVRSAHRESQLTICP